LRTLWRETTGRPAPEFLSKELIARALASRLQEQRLGGLDPHLHRLLISLEKPRGRADPPPKNRLGHSPGVRRQDPRGHGRARRVLLVGTDLRQPVGDCAQDHRHESEGARFFGLRGKDEAAQAELEVKSTGLEKDERRSSRGAAQPRGKGVLADEAGGDQAIGDRG
jgi:hypothetical protein